ncbi:unnamed protein product [Linum tenue]|uniref:Uncharacterized protein n=1 Tax=Linum tenue TaxID=586396 RepID=A0AAV0JS64_9ROSI|nr:unnamed protein product [Linum tenue]
MPREIDFASRRRYKEHRSILEEVIQAFDMNRGFGVRFVGWRHNRVVYLVVRKTISLYPTASRLFDFQV